MTSSRNLRFLDMDQLADECANHTKQFFDQKTHDTSYCYELFRRAIVNRNQYAWEKIYSQYQPLVVGWVRHHNSLAAAGEDIDFFVNCVFDRMWSAIDAEKFKEFDDLRSLLRYLQMCVNSVIIDFTRSGQVETVDPEATFHLSDQNLSSIENLIADKLERRRLWQAVVKTAHNEKELIVICRSFLDGLKPAEIYAAHPELFECVGEVYQIKRNLINRLRRNPIIRQFLSQ